MFARAERTPGTAEYEDYYREKPELKTTDDRIRTHPPLLEPGSRYYDPVVIGDAARHFKAIGDIEVDEGVVSAWLDRLRASQEHSKVLKEMAIDLGAVAAGCTAVDERFVYSHKGRLDHDYGRPIAAADHPHALVFLVEMAHDAMQHAPRVQVLRESALQYYRAAVIAQTIRSVLRALEASAFAHYDAHYDVILPPLAVAAGLGELGRNNILIADRFGSRVRIGAVTTDLTLDQDQPRSLGVRAFCDVCKKCSENCPTGSLSSEAPEVIRGVSKWGTNIERCYSYWRRIGTDCGICMAVCPFSHKEGWFHNAVRRFVKVHRIAAHIARFGDDLVYGRRWYSNPDST